MKVNGPVREDRELKVDILESEILIEFHYLGSYRMFYKIKDILPYANRVTFLKIIQGIISLAQVIKSIKQVDHPACISLILALKN